MTKPVTEMRMADKSYVQQQRPKPNMDTSTSTIDTFKEKYAAQLKGVSHIYWCLQIYFSFYSAIFHIYLISVYKYYLFY